jgi:anti-anti-sigma regulatory factor
MEMPMTWQSEPKIEPREQDGVIVLHLEGDLILDMPSEWRQAVIDGLDAQRDHERVVVDLSAVSRLGSWGEKRIKSFANGVVGIGGRVAVVIDPHRSAMFAGLRAELSGTVPAVVVADALDGAIASLKVGQ